MLISLNLSLESPWAARPAGSPLPPAQRPPSPWCSVPRRRAGLPSRQLKGTDGQEGRHRHRLSRFARYSEMLMLRSSAEQNEMLTTWNFPQNRRFLFRPALTYTHTHMHARTHICRIINCYVMTPDYMPTSTVWYGGNPALKNPVLEQPLVSHGAWKAVRWHNSFFMEQPGALCSITVQSICCGGRRARPCLRSLQRGTKYKKGIPVRLSGGSLHPL